MKSDAIFTFDVAQVKSVEVPCCAILWCSGRPFDRHAAPPSETAAQMQGLKAPAGTDEVGLLLYE